MYADYMPNPAARTYSSFRRQQDASSFCVSVFFYLDFPTGNDKHFTNRDRLRVRARLFLISRAKSGRASFSGNAGMMRK
jgi:hypothetical protein